MLSRELEDPAMSIMPKEKQVTLPDILPIVQQLPTLDKLRLIRFLAEELDLKENISPLEPYKVYHLATPYEMYGAGQLLMDALTEASEDGE